MTDDHSRDIVCDGLMMAEITARSAGAPRVGC